MYGVSVRFFDSYRRNELRGGEYYYEAYAPVAPGDVVVVDTSKGLAIAQVTNININNPGFSVRETRTIIQVIDLAQWEEKELERTSRLT